MEGRRGEGGIVGRREERWMGGRKVGKKQWIIGMAISRIRRSKSFDMVEDEVEEIMVVEV